MDMSIKLNASYPAGITQASSAPVTPFKPAAPSEPVKGEEPQRVALEKAVTDIREFVQASQRNLDFSIDDTTGKVVVKVIATDSGEVIRQIPSETALKLAQNLSDASSVLFDSKA
ncbi:MULTISPECIES: flagellar protein FlaG [Pseudomonas]|jgi:flagellar protein FlaG|uniref:Flagellar protein FlaG n=1 Tax=Pseudomonas rhodesiae TaxID=76760 RepID=A0A8I1E1S1_9PSED|nr:MULTISPECIES: flagellar protein FlaG [Pseudomonas]OXS22762.1 flagellar biosynthesis protein FlaG [Pseudomonas fluorescens]MBB4811578.1 flagellar protein FlaG [Pseudomonas rhodesiae]MBI6602027.1 flagellar protein FlaG [Pseudomonas sp. S4_EA_1b]MBI6623325.1 flagellar protein FlaG [Pseudomonas rhodesiae]MBX4139123.1 flagellar protein FlaG [Pseudomonas sp. S5F11]